MPRSKKRICSVTGITTSVNNFYTNQSHVKAVDNLRRLTGATKMNQINLVIKDQWLLINQRKSVKPKLLKLT